MKIFVTGTDTNVGKTIVSAILTEALQADYWKPIQAGDLQNSDTHKVQKLISNPKTQFHPNTYALDLPASPHWAAQQQGITLQISQIQCPITSNHLIIEGAGGLLVPINSHETILDCIEPDYQVIIVSKHYLGSINHTLLTVNVLKQAQKNILGIVFNGEPNPATEQIILQKTQLNCIGHLHPEPYFDTTVIQDYAEQFLTQLKPYIL